MVKELPNYYDTEIDIEALLLDGHMIDEIFYYKDLQQRKLFLNSEINMITVSDIVKHIMQFNAEDKGKDVADRRPILLYISSPGGDVDAGFELIDIIKMSKTPVYTINLGYWYSMGFLIGLAGHKRYATTNATLLMHDGTNCVYDSGAKVLDRIAFQQKIDDRIKAYVLERSKITSKEYNNKLRVEWYMFADEAKEKGFIDYIIGKDCDIDEIV